MCSKHIQVSELYGARKGSRIGQGTGGLEEKGSHLWGQKVKELRERVRGVLFDWPLKTSRVNGLSLELP